MTSLTKEQFPWTAPYGLADGPLKAKGPTAEALKRFAAHVSDEIQWGDFDQHYNRDLWEFIADLKIKQGIRKKSEPRDGSYGPEVWEHVRTRKIPKGRPNAGKWALDFYARKIVQDEAGYIATQTDLAKVQFYIAEFWNIAIANNHAWNYSQHRPGDTTVHPAAGGWNDCSLIVIQACRYAQDKTGIKVPDPSKWDYKGWGNTDLYEDDWPHIGSPFRIGDLAHFHSARHVLQCIKPGTFSTAVWGSNGSSSEPQRWVLTQYYRFPEEFMFVVRPPLTMEELNA